MVNSAGLFEWCWCAGELTKQFCIEESSLSHQSSSSHLTRSSGTHLLLSLVEQALIHKRRKEYAASAREELSVRLQEPVSGKQEALDLHISLSGSCSLLPQELCYAVRFVSRGYA